MSVPEPKAPQKISDPDELMELKDWWNKNGNTVSSIALVVILILLGVKYWNRHQESRANRASLAATQALDVSSLEKVAADFPSSGDAPVAMLRAAFMSCGSGSAEDLQVAREKYTQFLRKYSKHELAPLARLGIAYTDEATGKFAEALKVYEEFLAQHKASEMTATEDTATGTIGDGNYLLPIAVFGRARCLALNNEIPAAQTALDQFIAAMPNTSWAALADELKANLDKLDYQAPATAKSFDDALNLLGGAAAPVAEPAPAPEAAPEAPAPAAEAPAPAPEAPAPAPAAAE